MLASTLPSRRKLAHSAILYKISKAAMKQAKAKAFLNGVESKPPSHSDPPSSHAWHFMRKYLLPVVAGILSNLVYIAVFQDRTTIKEFDSYKSFEKFISEEMELYQRPSDISFLEKPQQDNSNSLTNSSDSLSKWIQLTWEMIRYNFLTDFPETLTVSGFIFDCHRLMQYKPHFRSYQQSYEGTYFVGSYDNLFSKILSNCMTRDVAIQKREDNFVDSLEALKLLQSAKSPVIDWVIYKAPFKSDDEELELRDILKRDVELESEFQSVTSMEDYLKFPQTGTVHFFKSPYHPSNLFNPNSLHFLRQLIISAVCVDVGIRLKLTYRRKLETHELLTGLTELFLG